MTITTVTTTNHIDGIRARFEITLTDGRTIQYGPRHYVDSIAASADISQIESEVESFISDTDAEEAETDNVGIQAHNTASLITVARQYIKRSMAEEDPYTAYARLKTFLDYKTAQGWTNAQVKSNLSLTDAQWDLIANRWTYLNTNSTTLLDYETVRDGDIYRLEL